jgi:uncharacterized membrane protein YkvA (DUF1232 family)
MGIFDGKLDKETAALIRGEDPYTETSITDEEREYRKYARDISDEATFNTKKQYVAKGLAEKNKGPIVEMWDQVQALWRYVASDEVSWVKKVAPLAALVYLVSPIDLVPDLIPLAGLLDDAGVLGIAIASLGSVLNDFRKSR